MNNKNDGQSESLTTLINGRRCARFEPTVFHRRFKPYKKIMQ